jgi:lupus La protein|eukprot:gene11090-7892_t
MAAQIKRQVEFYFSDSNYRKDTFLRAAAESDAEGFVPISVLLTFNKLKSFTTSVAEVAEAIADSDALVLNAAKDKVKRSEPLPDVDTSAERTLYVKGYPTDDADVTIESITEYFSAFGKVNMVKLRKTLEKTFKGSVLVEFGSVAEMEAALKATHEYKGKPFVQVSTFADWNNERQAVQNKRKRKSDNDAAEAEDKEDEELQFESGLVFRVTGVPPAATALQLKQFFKEVTEEVKFVDLAEGGSAVLRVANKDAAAKIASKAAEGLELVLEGADEKFALTAKALEGAEETQYWSKFRDTMRGRGGDKRGGGGRGGGRGRGRGGKRQRR